MKKKRRKKKKKVNKEMAVLLVVAGVFVFAVVVSYLNQPKEGKKPSAAEYFEISGIVTEGDIDEHNGLRLYGLNFNITAIEGDAHDITVNSAGLAGMEPWEIGTMVKGKPYYFYLDFASSFVGSWYISRPNEEGNFPLKLQISSVEASGLIKIDVPPPH